MPRQPRPLRVEPLEDRLTPAAAGDLDPTFGAAGIVTLTQPEVTRVAAVPDGRSIALVKTSASNFALERFEPDGTPDATFGTGGVAPLPQATGSYADLVALPDGGALLVTITGDVTRIAPAGTVDTSFGTGGTAGVGFGVTTAAVQPDGRILVAGGTLSVTATDVMAVARLTATGQLDTSFGSGGKAFLPVPSGQYSQAEADSVAVQPDGGVVLGGEATNAALQQVPVAARLTAAGQVDPTFGTGGQVVVTFPQQAHSLGFQAASVLADGRILLAAEVTTATGAEGGAVRLTAAGQLDPTYAAGGLAVTAQFITGFDSSPFVNTTIDALGRVIFSTEGLTTRGSLFTDDAVFRLAPNGSADAQFGSAGRVDVSALPGLNQRPDLATLESGLAVQGNGDILLGGLIVPAGSGTTTGALARLLGNGTPAGYVPTAAGTITVGGAANGTFQTVSPAAGTYGATGTITAFPGVTANARVTTADVNGDGTPDYVVGAGPGGPPEVTVVDGKTGATLAQFLAFEPSFTGGVFVAAADLTGDGKADVVVTPDQGGGPRVVIFSIATGGTATMRASFFGINDPNFRGGARPALGDVNHDGTPDLAVAAGFLGGPRVALFDGKTLLSGNPTKLVNDFFAFPGSDATTLRNGAYVSIGDLNGDGYGDLIFGGGPGGAPRVFALSGQLVLSGGGVPAAQASPVANFFVAGNSTDRGGVRVAAVGGTGGGAANLVVGSGAGDPARVRVYTGTFSTPGEPSSVQDVGVFGGAALPDGVYVG